MEYQLKSENGESASTKNEDYGIMKGMAYKLK